MTTALIFNAWSADWSLNSKVDFNGTDRLIYVHPEVTTLDIRADLYTAWIDWMELRDNSKFPLAMRYSGLDSIGGGQYTGDIYFLSNGWKLVIDLTKVRVSGVLYSDNYPTAFYSSSLEAQYPATVAALVNTVTVQVPATVTAQDIREEIDANSTKLAEMPDNVWTHPFVSKILTVAKFLGLK